jgi:APA family basic amino acid/polyamine antiporter
MIAPRLYVAMADDGVFPAAAAVLHPRWGTPARAIATQAVLASLLVAVGTFDTIVAFFVFITVVFIAATVASVFVLRHREPDLHVPLHPWPAVVFLALVAALLLLIAASNPVQALLGVVIVGAAVPVYRMIHARRAPALEELVR